MNRPDGVDDVRGLIEHSQDIIITVGDDGTITFVNRAVERTLGYEPEALIGTNAFEHIHEADRAALWDRFLSLIDRPGKATERVQHRMCHRDGSVRWVESIGSNQRDTHLDGYVINSRDITEAKVYEATLEEYRDYTEAIFDSFEDGFFVMDTAANLERWNRTVTQDTGYTDEEVASMSAADFVPEEQYDVIAENLQTALETGDARFEADLVGKDGHRTPYEFMASRLEDPDGETVVAGLGRDITDRKRRERELRRLRRAIEASGHAVYITDIDGRIEYVNPAFKSVTGYTESEVIGANPRLLQSGEMSDGYYEDLWATLLEGSVWEEEITNRRKDGELYTARQTIAPIQDSDGDIDGFVAIQKDITEEKARIERLKTFRQAIESATELIAAVDPEYRYLFANDQYLTYHDLTRETIPELTLNDALAPDVWTQAKPFLDRALSGESVRYRMERASPVGQPRTLDIHYSPLPAPDTDEILGVVATMRDVTELEERQRQLIVLSRVLRHNLQNDMNVILGHAELITDAGGPTMDVEADAIISQSEQLLDTADKIRDITELFAADEQRESIDVPSLLNDVVTKFREQHPGSELTTAIQPVGSVLASTKLRSALEELLHNAIKHNDHAQPRIELSTTVRDGFVEIAISDNGPGIPEMERDVLMNKRYEEPLYHGSGLGLWLVYWIVTRSNGTIEFRQNEPRGSVITIRIPTPDD